MMARLVVAGLLGACDGSRLRSSREWAVPDEALLEETHYDDFGLDEDTWMGLEDPDDAKSFGKNLAGLVAANTSSLAAGMALQNLSTSYPPVLVLGLFNTGTNLVEKLLYKNFHGLSYSGVTGLPVGLNVWKHIKPDQLKQEMARRGTPNLFQNRGVVAVAVMRDPMSWVQSMRKAPYDLAGCMYSRSWDVQGCTFPAPGIRPSTVWGTSPNHVTHQAAFYVNNIESVWNEWNHQYDDLEHLGFAPHKTVVTSYEEMLLDTHAVLERVAAAMGHPPPAKVKHVVRPAKNHGSPNGREAALRKLKSQSYLKSYTHQQRYNVCSRLDQSLMHLHNYHDCDEWVNTQATSMALNATAAANATEAGTLAEAVTANATEAASAAPTEPPQPPRRTKPIPSILSKEWDHRRWH